MMLLTWETVLNYLKIKAPLFHLLQPIWRDEAFAVLAALRPLSEIIKISTEDFTPPLFLALLHYWIKLFGHSEIAIRILPLLFDLATLLILFYLTKQLAQVNNNTATHFPFLTVILATVSPTLIFYAFEARTYSLLALLSTASMYFFLKKQRFLYIVVGVLGLYTHYYFVFNLITQCVYNLLTPHPTAKFRVLKRRFIDNLYIFASFVFFTPWAVFALKQITVTISEGTWRPPVTIKLWLASLGSLYTGYLGEPPDTWMWILIQLVSFILLILAIIVLKRNFKIGLLIFLWMVTPTVLVLTASLVTPLWFNRYLIYVTIAENIMVALFVNTLSPKARFLTSIVLIGLIVRFVSWFTPFQTKTDYRTPITELKKTLEPTDMIAVTDPRIIFEAQYYLMDTNNRVKIYNSKNYHIPSYMGTVLIGEDDIITELPTDRRVYLINRDTSIEQR